MPASGRRANPLPPGERRAAIVRAVLPLLVEHGDAITSRQIASAAGVSEGTVFNVFTDKDDLIAAALDEALDQAPFERAVAAIDADLALEAQLVRATALIQHRIVDIWRLVSGLGRHPEHAARPLPLSAALTTLFDRHADALAVAPEEAARLLRALTLALTHPTLAAEAMPAERIVAVFLDGVRGAARDTASPEARP